MPGEDFVFLSVYITNLVYLIVVIFNNKPFYKFWKIEQKLFVNTLVLFSLSAFLLNYSIPIFADFELYVKAILIGFYLSLLSLSSKESMPNSLMPIAYFFFGLGISLILYFAVYLIPVSPIAILGVVIFGFSLHLIVPIIVFCSALFVFIKTKKSKLDKIAFSTGLGLSLLCCVFFLVKWNNLRMKLHEANATIITRPESDLPPWLSLCQEFPTDRFSQKILKGSMAFDTFDNLWNGGINPGAGSLQRKHDPLINLGIALFDDLDIDNNTRVKILKSQYDLRHETQRKLWSEVNLETVDVLSNTKIFPAYRMAYTEKIISIKNTAKRQFNQQEASFTFHLPEGSVASSLSLWIDGVEEPSRLSTKAKADSAYATIVGVERRDPALLHWQEGNTLTLTVFPCTPAEIRKFRLGVSSPLEKNGDRLKLPNVYFEGPDLSNAIETTIVEFDSDQKIDGIKFDESFKPDGVNRFIYTGSYRPYWEVECPSVPLANQSFSFEGKSYNLKEYEMQQKKFDPEIVYLDINKSWTKKEFDQIWDLVKDKMVIAFDSKTIELKEANRLEVFGKLSAKNFSLFPFYKIGNRTRSLVVSKSTLLSPNISDLEKTDFSKKLISFIGQSDEKVNLFQLGNTSSPFLKTLKELQLFNFKSGNLEILNMVLKEETFPKAEVDLNQVDFEIAQFSIERDSLSQEGSAPDHLLRLFNYNKIMDELGLDYFDKQNPKLEQLVALANEAYIVSPVSSLIVLETQKDYDRFDIKENQNSLKNASMKSSGAVPEPHEWLLIGLLLGLIVWLKFFWIGKRS